ncbi:MAG: NnrU family protein [Alphaproteobacteria bacterium]
MLSLALAAALFAGIHLGIAGTPLRAALVGKIGQGPYMGLFSLLSVGALGWLVLSYGAAPYQEVWVAPVAAKHATHLIMLIAIFFMVVGLTTPNPTSTGMESKLQEEEAAKGMVRITRHPFLWATMLWAVSHMAVNGDLATILLAASILTVGVFGTRSIDARRAALDPQGWERFAAQTSNIPFVAIAQGRNSLKIGELGWWRLVLAAATFGALFYYHGLLFGVPVM